MTARDIATRLYFHHMTAARLMVPNCFLYAWESDFLYVTKSGYVTEYEIKISRGDFRADFKKQSKHRALAGLQVLPHIYATRGRGTYEELAARFATKLRTTPTPSRFFYATARGLLNPDEIPEYAGLVELDKHVWVIKKAPRLNHEKITTEQEARLNVSIYHRMWRLFCRGETLDGQMMLRAIP